MSEQDKEMEAAAEKCRVVFTANTPSRKVHESYFKAGWKAASERKVKNAGCDATCLNYSDEDTVAEIQSLQSKLATALESLSRIQVRIDESNHHPSDLKAISELVREALTKIKGDAK